MMRLKNEVFRSFGPALELALLRQVQETIDEDLGDCDYTGLLIEPERRCSARLICRDAAVVCGLPWFQKVFEVLDPEAELRFFVAEGEFVQPGAIVCEVRGLARAMLTAERSAMNWLQLLSGVATRTRYFVRLIEGTSSSILDTRKTVPGMRLAQKYAVRVGGGLNQRLALYDGILIKENHIAAAGGIEPALSRAAAVRAPGVSVQIEVENLEQLELALAAGATSVLLDNFDLAGLTEAVRLNAGRAVLEASGGVDEASVRAIAQTGVDRISIGSLTKDLKAVDYSLRVLPAQ